MVVRNIFHGIKLCNQRRGIRYRKKGSIGFNFHYVFVYMPDRREYFKTEFIYFLGHLYLMAGDVLCAFKGGFGRKLLTK